MSQDFSGFIKNCRGSLAYFWGARLSRAQKQLAEGPQGQKGRVKRFFSQTATGNNKSGNLA